MGAAACGTPLYPGLRSGLVHREPLSNGANQTLKETLKTP